MAIAISTIGTKVSYIFETTAGTRPESGYHLIPQVKEIPEMNPQPETLETTSLENKEYKTYIDGLKDLGGSLDFTVNFTQELFDLWEAEATTGTNASAGGVMAQWENTTNGAKKEGRAMWLCIDIAGLNKSCYISVIPSHLGLPAASVNAVLDGALHFIPVGEPLWDDDPTYAS